MISGGSCSVTTAIAEAVSTERNPPGEELSARWIMKSFEWLEATSVEQASEESAGKGTIKAGGVDLLDLMKEHIVEPSRLVNIRNIRGMDAIDADEKGLRIGPLATLAKIAANETIQSTYGALAGACGEA